MPHSFSLGLLLPILISQRVKQKAKTAILLDTSQSISKKYQTSVLKKITNDKFDTYHFADGVKKVTQIDATSSLNQQITNIEKSSIYC